MFFRNKKEVVVVTGASAGVGRATAREFARRGASVALIARGEEGLKGAAREVEALGGKALPIVADVAESSAVQASAEIVEDNLGPIDIWINNAMVSVFSPFMAMTDAEFQRVMEVTFMGYVHGTRAALQRMMPRNKGTIVQVGSALAYRGIPLQSAYCSAKHAIEGFTESVRTELMHDGRAIHLTMVQLPAVNTPQFEWTRSRMPSESQPVPPIYQPEVAARAIYWAAHHRRREVNVGGSTSVVITGNKILPGVGDHYLALTGYDSQMTNEPRDTEKPDNLWEPVNIDYGAHGRFDDRASDRSVQLWVTMHRRVLMAGLVAIAGLLRLRRAAAA